MKVHFELLVCRFTITVNVDCFLHYVFVLYLHLVHTCFNLLVLHNSIDSTVLLNEQIMTARRTLELHSS